mmetsp:Transcript_62850/g.205197  ORF Transcript_62850/g.205197 Transcript_62850/m.205197 type:complete len:559 (-) Transcript_62850:245-1921(-)
MVAHAGEGRASARPGVASEGAEGPTTGTLAVGTPPSTMCDVLREVVVVGRVVELLCLSDLLHCVAVIRDVTRACMMRSLVHQCRNAHVRIDVVEPTPAQVDEVLSVTVHAALLVEGLGCRANWARSFRVAFLIGDPLPNIAHDIATARVLGCIICWVHVVDAVGQLPVDEVHGEEEPLANCVCSQRTTAAEPLLPEALGVPAIHLRDHSRNPSLSTHITDGDFLLGSCGLCSSSGLQQGDVRHRDGDLAAARREDAEQSSDTLHCLPKFVRAHRVRVPRGMLMPMDVLLAALLHVDVEHAARTPSGSIARSTLPALPIRRSECHTFAQGILRATILALCHRVSRGSRPVVVHVNGTIPCPGVLPVVHGVVLTVLRSAALDARNVLDRPGKLVPVRCDTLEDKPITDDGICTIVPRKSRTLVRPRIFLNLGHIPDQLRRVQIHVAFRLAVDGVATDVAGRRENTADLFHKGHHGVAQLLALHMRLVPGERQAFPKLRRHEGGIGREVLLHLHFQNRPRLLIAAKVLASPGDDRVVAKRQGTKRQLLCRLLRLRLQGKRS